MSKGRLILYITKALHQTSTAYYDLERIVQQVNNGSYEYFLPDSLGSVRQVAGDNQFPSYSQSFDPFGNIVSWEGKGGSSFGYVGETNDPSGLVFLRARFYSPTQGRFITRDPFPGIITAPVTLTQYNYSLNNPILFTDPSGQTVPLIVAVAGIGFAAGAVIDAFQQTNGFTDFCDFDLLQSLSAGIGGGAAATSLAIFTISGIGYFGLGLQGVGLGLSWLGLSSISTSLFIAGTSTGVWAGTAMTWLFTLPTPKDATSMVNEAALRANNKVGPGIGPIHGTKVHTAMSQEINELGNIELNSEISYLDGEIVKYGTPGSIRVDVVYGPIKDPISIFDLKTGNAILTNDRILQIQRQLPRLDIPIIEIK